MSREVALGHTAPHTPCSPTRVFYYAGQRSSAPAQLSSVGGEEAIYVKKWRLGPEGLVRAAVRPWAQRESRGRGSRQNICIGRETGAELGP